LEPISQAQPDKRTFNWGSKGKSENRIRESFNSFFLIGLPICKFRDFALPDSVWTSPNFDPKLEKGIGKYRKRKYDFLAPLSSYCIMQLRLALVSGM